MRVLFISSGNNKDGISPIVENQGESLSALDIDVHFYTIQGKGLKGYLKNVLPLRKYVKKQKFDVIHAHYSLSALVATLAGCKPLIVSLMGSDVRMGFLFKTAIKIYSLLIWDDLIVKSQDMADNLCIDKCKIIPNGINTALLKPNDKKNAVEILGWDERKKHILFAADPSRPEKNFKLLKKAYDLLYANEHIEIHVLENIPHQAIPNHMNASEVVVLTSLWEGSPNVVKEAMACNRPVVSTAVGDIAWLFGNEPGHFLTSFDYEDVSNKLGLALEFAEKVRQTNGRKRIIELGLDSTSVAKRIAEVYHQILESSHK